MLKSERRKIKKQERQALVWSWKSSGCCLCQRTFPAALEAHHVDPAEKQSSIARLVSRRAALSTLQRELDKCVCLCNGCHLKVHRGEIIVGSWDETGWVMPRSPP